MNVTINSDATELTFSQELLDDAYPLSIVLTREFGCNSTILPIDTSGITITNNSFTIDVTDMYGATTKERFDGGVYKFTLIFAYPDANIPSQVNGVSSTYCFVNDYYLKCSILNNNTPELLNKYRSMFYANDCDECACTHLCTIYNDLIQEPNGTTDCGCN